ncbi:MAG: glycosyltransferase family 39 protein [Pyrinomonadaceae bacterium]|nr:glycosyltransferase family 39 protein [Pyrinomonadaceae bacterium]
MLDQIRRQEKLTWILFAAVVIVLYLFALDLPLLGPDEPRYSQVAREMYERGDWVTTTLGGYNWFEKPALLYWLQITFYNLFGVSEFSARLGSALFGLGTIGCLFVLGRQITAEVRRRGEEIKLVANQNSELQTLNPELPLWLALVAASSIGLIAFSRGASFDIILTFPITASLVSFFVWEISHRARGVSDGEKEKFSLLSVPTVAIFLFYFFIGVALIAKGLIGIVFPFAIVSFYYVLRWKLPGKPLILSLFWGTIVSILVASAWYLPMYLVNGWEFIDEFFIQHHFKRYASNKYLHPQPFWFFWVILPAMTIPWIPFFGIATWKTIKEIISRKGAKVRSENQSPTTYYQLRVFALAWILVPLVFFSFSGSKLPGYILPSLPAACILAGEYISRFVGKNSARKHLLQILAFLTFLVVAILLQFALPRYAVNDSVKGLVTAANERGYTAEKILNFNTISHSIEFYGANRLLREDDGKQKRFDKALEIDEYMKAEEARRVLVLAPVQFEKGLKLSESLEVTKIRQNSELGIFLIERK